MGLTQLKLATPDNFTGDVAGTLLIQRRVSFAAGLRMRSCGRRHRCRSPLCPKCFRIEQELLTRQVYWGSVEPELRARISKAGRDRRWRLAVAVVELTLRPGDTAGSVLQQTRIARRLQRLLHATGGCICVTLLSPMRVRVAVGGLTERSIIAGKPPQRIGDARVEWWEGTRYHDLPEFGPRTTREFIRRLRPEPTHYWAADGKIGAKDLRGFHRFSTFGNWKSIVNLRAGEFPQKMKLPPKPEAATIKHTRERVERDLSRDVLRQFSRTFDLAPRDAMNLRDEALDDNNWNQQDKRCQIGDLLTSAFNWPQSSWHIPYVKLFVMGSRRLKRRGSIDIDSPELHESPAAEGPVRVLWREYDKLLSHPAAGGWRRNKPVAAFVRIAGRPGVTAVSNCSSFSTNAVKLDATRYGGTFVIQPLAAFMSDMLAALRGHDFHFPAPSALDTTTV